MVGLKKVLPYILAVFLSALLIFWIEPLYTKMLLPAFGGAPAVWISALMFFQAVLLAGYLYAHYLVKIPSVVRQATIHLALAAAAFVFLPPAIGAIEPGVISENPLLVVLQKLTLGIGLPMAVLAGTAPLVQRWFSVSGHKNASDPYFLYSASNVGSLGALLAFPLILEPSMTLSRQGLVWTGIFSVVIVVVLFCAYLVRGVKMKPSAPLAEASGFFWRDRLWVLALAAVPASMLSGVTLLITTDIAAVPLFWVVPLAVYLATYILAFAGVKILPVPRLRFVIGILTIPVPLFVLFGPGAMTAFHVNVAVLILLLLLFQFFLSFACHRELWRRRPDTRSLTHYYVAIALGGFLGGAFNAVVAPLVFNGVLEFPIVIILGLFLSLQADERKKITRETFLKTGMAAISVAVLVVLFSFIIDGGVTPPWVFFGLVMGGFVLSRLPRVHAAFLAALFIAGSFSLSEPNRILQARSFFGVVKVDTREERGVRLMSLGTTIHGVQSLDPKKALQPLSYYGSKSPVFEAWGTFHDQIEKGPVGTLGLGIGTIACYPGAGKRLTFFEIDPLVAKIASNPRYFTFLSRCSPSGGIVFGDGRLNIENSKKTFSLLILDAFTSDSVPVHLLTLEAFRGYFDHLNQDGFIIVNISNRHLDLAPVLGATARELGVFAVLGKGRPKRTTNQLASNWVIISRQKEPLKVLTGTPGIKWEFLGPYPKIRAWTDDYSNILEFLKF